MQLTNVPNTMRAANLGPVSMRPMCLPRMIRCTQGTLWVTLGVPELDVVLEAGQTVFVPKHRTVVLERLGALKVSFVVLPAEQPHASRSYVKALIVRGLSQLKKILIVDRCADCGE
jgi:hypothetical protein